MRASRRSATSVDVEDLASVEQLFAKVANVDAVVSCATGSPEKWQRRFGSIEQLTDESLEVMFHGCAAS